MRVTASGAAVAVHRAVVTASAGRDRTTVAGHTGENRKEAPSNATAPAHAAPKPMT
jgi:hypothetical protein